jgi:nucleotide-binding universal stress UspA family protein
MLSAMTTLDPMGAPFPGTKRYRHLLLPLDGSDTAEIALADAASVAASNGARLTLLYVVPPALAEMYGAATIVADHREGLRGDAAHRYLDSVRAKLEATPIEAHTAVAVGEAAEAILAYAGEHGVDLVVMATHGRSGWRRWVLGSVAERVLHAAAEPVLLVRVQPAGGELK